MANEIPTPADLHGAFELTFDGEQPTVVVTRALFIKILGAWFCIPAGFKSDGASVPWLLTLWIKPFDRGVLLFSVLHDYFYATQCVPRAFADLVYRYGLEVTANTRIAVAFYYGLRIGGWVAWWKHQRDGLHEYPLATKLLFQHIKERGAW